MRVRCVPGMRTGWEGWQAIAMILVKGLGACTGPVRLETERKMLESLGC